MGNRSGAVLLLGLMLSACAPHGSKQLAGEGPVSADPRGGVPEPAREFRAVWVATVDNIDWPSRPGLPADSQRVEALTILDRSVELGLNAVVLQVRPQCDALYASQLEPWSYYLTGQQGLAPEPAYDPLEFWVDEAHRRGLALHAWFNPYRVRHPQQRGPMAPSSVAVQRPDLVRSLGTGDFLWLDPGEPDVRELTLSVILDVVARYEIDGVHMDDYFYPYPSYNNGDDFPDDASWQSYQATGGQLGRADWRRHNVDLFVQTLHERLRRMPRQVLFGISPFGIWRPNFPPSIEAGLDQYGVLYADARRWLHEGWVDYFAPQLYWPISQVPQSFPVLLGWWTQNNPHGRHLWPGLFTSRVKPETGWPVREVTDQIMISRAMTPTQAGHIHFSARVLLDSARVGQYGDSLSAALRRGPYRQPVLPPATPWLDSQAPLPPVTTVQGSANTALLTWRPAEGEAPFLYVVYTKRQDSAWAWQVLPATRLGLRLQSGMDGADAPVVAVAVTAMDRMGNESLPQVRSLR